MIGIFYYIKFRLLMNLLLFRFCIGGLFFVVNGLEPGKFSNVVHGSVVDFNWDRFNVIKRFQPANTNFETPHDVCVSQNGTELYVTELNSKRIWKFQIGLYDILIFFSLFILYCVI